MKSNIGERFQVACPYCRIKLRIIESNDVYSKCNCKTCGDFYIKTADNKIYMRVDRRYKQIHRVKTIWKDKI